MMFWIRKLPHLIILVLAAANALAENNAIKEQMGPPTSLGDFNGAIPASGIAVGGGGIENSTSTSFKLTLPSGDIEVVKLLLYWNGEIVKEGGNYYDYAGQFDVPDKTVSVTIGSSSKSKSGTLVGHLSASAYRDGMWFNGWTVRADISDMKSSLRSGDNTIHVSNLTIPIAIDSTDKKAWFGVGAIAIYRNRSGVQPGKAYLIDGIDHGYNIPDSSITASLYRDGKYDDLQRKEYRNISRYYQPIASLPHQQVARVGILTTSAEGVWSSGKPSVRRGTSLEVFASGASAAAVAKTASTITDYSNRNSLTNRCVGSRACALGAKHDNWGNPVLAMDCLHNMCSAQGPEMDVMMVELPVPPRSNNIAIQPNSAPQDSSGYHPASLFWFAGAVYVGCEGPECFDCAGELMGDHILDDVGGCCLPGEIDKCGRCFGDNSCVDCAGVPYGKSILDPYNSCCLPQQMDDCGVCFGDNSCADCAGVPNGKHVLDPLGGCCLPAEKDLCGICNGGNECLDCAGVPYGSHVLDSKGGCCLPAEKDLCGICNGGNECLDCAGVPNGNRVLDGFGGCCLPIQKDKCGVCSGKNTCLDCAGIPYGPKVEDNQGGCCLPTEIDKCGVCFGNDKCLDCNGIPNGDHILDKNGACCLPERQDLCGICWGGNRCLDCAGEPYGIHVVDKANSCCLPTEKDRCGYCSGDNSCVDCKDIPYGPYTLDRNDECCLPEQIDLCDICSGVDECVDCNGNPYGKADYDKYGSCCLPSDLDSCGVCSGNNSCLDCLGVPFGKHVLDPLGTCCMPSEKDKCGICFGANLCLDCNGVPSGPHILDKNKVCCLPIEMDLCDVCFGKNTCLDCAGQPNGPHIFDKQQPPACCLPSQVDACGVCFGQNDCLTPNCVEEKATTQEKRRARAARQAAKVLLNRTNSFSRQAEECNPKVSYKALRAKALRAFRNLRISLKEEFLRTHLICEGDSCVVVSTRATKQALKRLVHRLYRAAKKAKLNAIHECRIQSDRTSGLVTEDYRDAALKAVNQLPASNNSC